MIQRSKTDDAIALVILIVTCTAMIYGIIRLVKWREAEERTRAAEIRRCKAACERK